MEQMRTMSTGISIKEKLPLLLGAPTYIATLYIGLTLLSTHWSLFFIICIVGDIAYYYLYQAGKLIFIDHQIINNIYTYNLFVFFTQLISWSAVISIRFT